MPCNSASGRRDDFRGVWARGIGASRNMLNINVLISNKAFPCATGSRAVHFVDSRFCKAGGILVNKRLLHSVQSRDMHIQKNGGGRGRNTEIRPWGGADGGGRTHTLSRVLDFESSASANSATSALSGKGISFAPVM
jgi:hypothetical protein